MTSRLIRLAGGPAGYDGQMIEVDEPLISLAAPGVDSEDFLEMHVWVYAHTAGDGTPVFAYRESDD